MVSSLCSLILFFVLMEIKEQIQEQVRAMEIKEVNSSTSVDSALSVKCRAVITKRQKPRRFADVPRICAEVLFAI